MTSSTTDAPKQAFYDCMLDDLTKFRAGIEKRKATLDKQHFGPEWFNEQMREDLRKLELSVNKRKAALRAQCNRAAPVVDAPPPIAPPVLVSSGPVAVDTNTTTTTTTTYPTTTTAPAPGTLAPMAYSYGVNSPTWTAGPPSVQMDPISSDVGAAPPPAPMSTTMPPMSVYAKEEQMRTQQQQQPPQQHETIVAIETSTVPPSELQQMLHDAQAAPDHTIYPGMPTEQPPTTSTTTTTTTTTFEMPANKNDAARDSEQQRRSQAMEGL